MGYEKCHVNLFHKLYVLNNIIRSFGELQLGLYPVNDIKPIT